MARKITSQYIEAFLKRGNYTYDRPLLLWRRQPRVLVDFGFDEVEYTAPERFERAFSREAAQHWKLRRKPATLAAMANILQRTYNSERLKEQLNRANPLLCKWAPATVMPERRGEFWQATRLSRWQRARARLGL